MNISAVDFNSCSVDSIKIAVVSSGSLSRHSTLVSSIWDNRDNYYNTDTSLSSLLDDILNAVPQAREEYRPPWIILLKAATIDLLSDSEPWNVNAIADAISFPIKS